MAAPARVELPEPLVLTLGSTDYDISRRALVMGIVNRTPDSFYDHGAYFDLDKSLRLAESLVADGADIIDVGGVKAGAGPAVSVDEEIGRVVPAIEAIATRFEVPVSVDTWNAQVADAAYRAGAVLGNDISGFADPDYLLTAARHSASVVATHIRLRPRVDDPDPHYPNDDVVSAAEQFLAERVSWALAAGLRRTQVVIDAGLDLGKTTPQSLELLQASDRLATSGQPLLLSVSNKGMLGDLFSLEIGERGDATLAALALGIARGCRVLRVHDVRRARRVARSLEAILAQ